MSNKFWREAREASRLFCLEYKVDPDSARSSLRDRLDGKRKRICDWTYSMIEARIPGVDFHG